jgi:Flp pilus assembly protein TadG
MDRDKRSSRLRGQDGVAAVEFALIAPVVLLILVGVIQFGIVYRQYQVLQGAAREGARCASVQAGGFADCDVTTAVQNAALSYDLTNPPTVSVEGGGTVCTDQTQGQDVTVSWMQDFDMGALFNLVPGLPDTVSAEISGTFRCE